MVIISPRFQPDVSYTPIVLSIFRASIEDFNRNISLPESERKTTTRGKRKNTRKHLRINELRGSRNIPERTFQFPELKAKIFNRRSILKRSEMFRNSCYTFTAVLIEGSGDTFYSQQCGLYRFLATLLRTHTFFPMRYLVCFLFFFLLIPRYRENWGRETIITILFLFFFLRTKNTFILRSFFSRFYSRNNRVCGVMLSG